MSFRSAPARLALAAALCLALTHAPSAKAADAPGGAPAAAPAADAPKIEMPTLEWDFGTLPRGAACEHPFEIRNTGKSVLKILSTQASCGCTVPTLARTEIQPGESEPINVKYDSNRVGPFGKTVTVKSNDPAHASLVIHIKGTIVSDITVEPGHGVRWMEPVQRRAATQWPQRVTLNTDKLTELTIQGVESTDPHVTWTVVPGPDARTKVLALRLKPDTPVGPFNATLHVHSNSKIEPVVDVPVSADVEGDVHVEPRDFTLAYIDTSKAVEGWATVTDASRKGDFKLLDVKDTGGLVDVGTESITPGVAYRIHARLKPGSHGPGLFSGNLVLTTNKPEEATLRLVYSGAVPVDDPAILGTAPAKTTSVPGTTPPAGSAAPAVLSPGLSVSASSQVGSASNAKASAAAAADDASLPNGKPNELVVIAFDEVNALLSHKAARFVDARDTDRYAAGHIPGAQNFFVDTFNDRYPKFEAQTPRDARIVVYCDGVDCPMAHDLGMMLLGKGYTNLLYYKKGWEEWEAQKAPAEKGGPAQ